MLIDQSLYVFCPVGCHDLSILNLVFALLAGSGAEYVRKEVPLYVLPSSSLLNVVSPLTSFTDLQRVIYEEERAAYVEAIRQNMRWDLSTATFKHSVSVTVLFAAFILTFRSYFPSRDGKAHPLTFIHHTSTYQASMCKLMEYWCESITFAAHRFSVSLLICTECTYPFRWFFFCSLSPAIRVLQDRVRENEIRVNN